MLVFPLELLFSIEYEFKIKFDQKKHKRREPCIKT